MADNIPQLGYFLTYKFWQDAINLLEFQLVEKTKNRHFNTLSMFYYEGLDSQKKRIKKKKYFNTRIANNLFYGLEREFLIADYPIPKADLGLRRYKFFMYPTRVLYYAIGLYLLRLSQEFLTNYYLKQNQHIRSWYGGDLKFDLANETLVLRKFHTVWYKPHYKKFGKLVRKESNVDQDDKLIIHLDIQNYFEEISITKFLDILSENIQQSTQRQLRFDEITKHQIASFFKFLVERGIPQSDNDIISSYLGYLYLVFGDFYLDDVIKSNKQGIQNYSIMRYMDDMYISILFESGLDKNSREKKIHEVANRMSDILYEKLDLKLNTKTRFYWLQYQQDRDDLERSLKKVSPGHEIDDDDNPLSPDDKIELLFKQVRNLKSSSADPSFSWRKHIDEEILKYIYDPDVEGILSSGSFDDKLKALFSDFDFELVNAQPKPLTIMILHEQQATRNFRKHLLAKADLTTRDVDLVLNYLCQVDFRDNKVNRMLEKNNHMRAITRIYQDRKLYSKKPGYFNTRFEQTKRLAHMPNVIEQIRLRVNCERNLDYSVALNHLLNEIHAICYELDTMNGSLTGKKQKKYDQLQTIDFLIKSNVPHDITMQIQNLFDRRNKNPVSHPDLYAWAVTKEDYFHYRKYVGQCLEYLL